MASAVAEELEAPSDVSTRVEPRRKDKHATETPRGRSTIAPRRVSLSRSRDTSIAPTPTPDAAAIAAAVPAASPVAMHGGISFVAWCTR